MPNYWVKSNCEGLDPLGLLGASRSRDLTSCFARDLVILTLRQSHVHFFSNGDRTVRGVTRGARGAQFPGRRMTAGAPESPNNFASTFFNAVHLLPKGLRFEHGGAKRTSCPGRRLTSLRPCALWRRRLKMWRRASNFWSVPWVYRVAFDSDSDALFANTERDLLTRSFGECTSRLYTTCWQASHTSERGLQFRVEKNPFFFQKQTTHLDYLYFFITGFCSFFKKNTKSPFWIVFIASCNITIFRITQ